MSDDLKDTQPNLIRGETKPNPISSEAKRKFPRWLVALAVIALIVIGILGGYASGMSRRYSAQNTQISGQLQDQFQLGMQAMSSGNYDNAEKYFKFILQVDPNYPGIQDAYSNLLIKMKVSPTPVFSPTPLVSPTPDTRGTETIFNTAQSSLNSGDWDGAIANLDSLRKSFPTYRTAEVDGMYYIALRQRGVSKITTSCKDTNLAGGIYDLTLAEHFVGVGNLDSMAQSLRTYARLYINGASLWDQDWAQAQTFFAQVMTGYPNMSDSSCLTATRRWYQATIMYAEQLQAAGDSCGAAAQYASAFALNIDDPLNTSAFPAATAVENKCNPPAQNTPVETPTETLTETPTPG